MPFPLPFLSRARLLVVEDNPDTADLLEMILEDRYTITLAHSFEEADGLLDGRPYDLFLFDIHLGGPRTGVELLRSARARPAYRRVPAIACTAYATGTGRRDEHDLSIFDLMIRKPFEMDDLLDAVSRMLTTPTTEQPGTQRQ